jgi:two-component system nitrogen regulation response regulator GlnG
MLGKVLIIDHCSPWSRFAAETLSANGYDSAKLGRQGHTLALLKKANLGVKECDLIIVDTLSDRTVDNMVKPLEVAKTISMRFPNVPLMVVSSRPTPNEAVLAYEVGASAYIAKTFDGSQLIELVQQAIQRAHSRGCMRPHTVEEAKCLIN